MPDKPDTDAVNITINKTVHVGLMPRRFMRHLLHQQRQAAMGFTPADVEANAKLEEGDDPIPPSESRDGFALLLLYFTAVGVCWPTPMDGCPTFQDCRHNSVEYGQEVIDWFSANHGHPNLTADLRDNGREILNQMMRSFMVLQEAIEEEMVFTEEPEEASTGG